MPVALQRSSESSVSVLNGIRNVPGLTPSFPVEAGSSSKSPHTKLVRRVDREYSQSLRLGVQLFVVALNVWIGVQFYLWVRWAESGGRALEVSRPAGVEGWLPIAALMNLKYLSAYRQLPHVHPAGLFLLYPSCRCRVVFRKAFCSWLCPVGTVSEYLWKLGRATFRRNFRSAALGRHRAALAEVLPAWLLRVCRGSMSAAAIAAFLGSPYGAHCRRADAELLPLPRQHGSISCPRLVVASVFVQNFWCRYLCPYGAFLGLASLLSPIAHPAQPRHLHRLRQVREGVSLGAAGRQADPDPLGRVHRLPGMRGSLSGQRCTGHDRAWRFAEASRYSSLEHGRWGCGHLLRPGRLCQVQQSLEHRTSEARLPTTRAHRRTAASPRFPGPVRRGRQQRHRFVQPSNR